MGMSRAAWLAHVLPLRCATCDREVRPGRHAPALCPDCGNALTAVGTHTERLGDIDVVAPFRFDGVPRQALHELKFRGNTPLAIPLGTALGRVLFELPAGEHLLVPVPLHWRRRWSRGHDQAAGLARVAARARPGFRVRHALRRCHSTAPQVGLGREARKANLAAAFAVRYRHRAVVRGARVVLLDDVVTTGATLLAARAALLTAGAAEVVLAAAAVVLPGSVALARELGDDVAAE